MNGRWRKLADRKAGEYREASAYLCGVRDGVQTDQKNRCAGDASGGGAARGLSGAAAAGTRAARGAETSPVCSGSETNPVCSSAGMHPTHGGAADASARAGEAALWVRAVDATRRELNRQSPARAAFFADYYGLDAPRRRLSVASRLWRLSEKYHMTEDALKTWRREALDLLILAATQLGLLRPFDGCGGPGGEGDA